MQERRKATIEITLDAGVAVRRSPLLFSLGRTLLNTKDCRRLQKGRV